MVWGERGARGFVVPPFTLLFIQVFLPTPLTKLFKPTTFHGLSRRRFLLVVFHPGVPPPPGGHPHVPASVASPIAPAVSPLHSLSCGNNSISLDLDITLYGWPPLAGPAPPAAVSSPPPALSSSSSSSQSLTPLTKPSLRPKELFKLSEIKDVKSYLEM